MSVVLAIDTASDAFALAVARDGVVVESMEQATDRNHSQELLAAIDGRTTRLDEVTALVVVRGPGSYAGLRVGIATAEGIALARGLPITGVGTLEAVVAASGRTQGIAIHPAGRGEFAVQAFAAGRLTGEITIAAGLERSAALCGEGAALFGGLEIGPLGRCRAASLMVPAGGGSSVSVDAIYLREPHITRPRTKAGRPA